MKQSKKTAAAETVMEKAAIASTETLKEEKPAAPKTAAPAKKSTKTKASAEPAAEAQPETKKRGRKPAAAKDNSAAAEKKPAAKRTKKTAAPEQSDYEKSVAAVKTKTEKASSSFNFAAQVTITGKVDGIFYVKAEDGKVYTEGYDYKDADLNVTADSETFADIMNGKADFDSAVMDGKISFDPPCIKTIITFKKVVF